MKRGLLLAVLLLVSIAFVTTGFAQEKAKAPEKPTQASEQTAAAAPEKAEAPMKAAKLKAKPMNGFAGEVTRVDLGGKILMVKGKKANVTFDLINAKVKGYRSIDEMKPGDKVFAKYTADGVEIKKMGGKKAPKAKKAPKE